jgi:signal recognition particle subunit SRP19
MSRPVLEEVDDVDNMDMDIAEFDPSLRTPLAPARAPPTVVRSQDQEPPLFPGAPSVPRTQTLAQAEAQKNVIDPAKFSQEEREHLKRFQIVYPCYFDKNRSHKEGRRVSALRAVENPLAKTISDACRSFSLPVILELDKSHPQDFGNPGRVRVLIKDNVNGGQLSDSRYKTKRGLLNSIADYLASHPTTLDSISKNNGVPWPQEFDGFVPEELPRVKGFKMNSIVPVHSRVTLKHPMTKTIYDPEPEQPKVPAAPKQPKKKVMKIRG